MFANSDSGCEFVRKRERVRERGGLLNLQFQFLQDDLPALVLLKAPNLKKKIIMTFFCHDTNVRYFNSVLFALSSWVSGPDFMSTESFYLEVK